MGCTLEKAIEIRDAYANGFPGIAKYKEKASRIVRTKGYILLCSATGHKTYWEGFSEGIPIDFLFLGSTSAV